MSDSLPPVKADLPKLTVKEAQVAALARNGFEAWEIARRLNTAPHRISRTLARLAAIGIETPATHAALDTEQASTEPDHVKAERTAIAARIETERQRKRRKGEPGTAIYTPRVYRSHATGWR